MKIITWNCAAKFSEKASELLKLNPDIALIQECSRADADSLAVLDYKSLWFGDDKNRGVAIIHRPDWTVRQAAPSPHKWVVPFAVTGPEAFTLIAVWAWQEKGGPADYVEDYRKDTRPYRR